MSDLDDVLQYFRDMVGIKSNSQLDAEGRSSYLKSLPTRMTDKDVYLPAVQMEPETQSAPADWFKATAPPYRPEMPPAPPAPDDLGPDPYGRGDIMGKLAEAEGRAGVKAPMAQSAPFGMVSTAHHPKPMTAQEAQDYYDFLSADAGPHYALDVGEPDILSRYSVDVGEPQIESAPLAAMRRRR